MKSLLVAVLFLIAGAAGAFELDGVRKITLANAQGERIVIGAVAFTPLGGGRARFALTLDGKLEEYFLAMRPFRCLTGPQQRLCHFPVEREAPIVAADDLVPLEHALMFMRTPPASLHVNPFNGVYYRLRMSEAGIEGRLHEVDMDPFITPDSVPPERRQRPIRPQDLSPGDDAGHWLPILRIE